MSNRCSRLFFSLLCAPSFLLPMIYSLSGAQGQPEKLKGGVIEMIQMLNGKIGHIHLIDSDGTLHNDETSTHRPFGEGQLDFDAIMPVLNQSGCNSPWWAVDLCFWPGSWEATPGCKQFMDHLNEKYGTTAQGQAH